jgi:hypothetical protein
VFRSGSKRTAGSTQSSVDIWFQDVQGHGLRQESRAFTSSDRFQRIKRLVMEYIDGLPITEHCDRHKVGDDGGRAGIERVSQQHRPHA